MRVEREPTIDEQIASVKFSLEHLWSDENPSLRMYEKNNIREAELTHQLIELEKMKGGEEE